MASYLGVPGQRLYTVFAISWLLFVSTTSQPVISGMRLLPVLCALFAETDVKLDNRCVPALFRFGGLSPDENTVATEPNLHLSNNRRRGILCYPVERDAPSAAKFYTQLVVTADEFEQGRTDSSEFRSLLPYDKGERPPLTVTVERTRRVRIFARRRAEVRGDGSSQPVCWTLHSSF